VVAKLPLRKLVVEAQVKSVEVGQAILVFTAKVKNGDWEVTTRKLEGYTLAGQTVGQTAAKQEIAANAPVIVDLMDEGHF